jgi:hypothetical protein
MPARSKTQFILVSALLASIAIGGAVSFWQTWRQVDLDELRSKSEWSHLQAAELTFRNDHSPKPIFYNYEAYQAVGLRNTERSRTWILLNAKYKPKVKVMGPESIVCSRQDLEEILAYSPSISPETLALLQKVH